MSGRILRFDEAKLLEAVGLDPSVVPSGTTRIEIMDGTGAQSSIMSVTATVRMVVTEENLPAIMAALAAGEDRPSHPAAVLLEADELGRLD